MKTADPEEVQQVVAAWAERWSVVFQEFEASVRSTGPVAFRLGEWGWTTPIWGPMHLAAFLVKHGSEQLIDEYFLNEYRRRWRKTERQMLRDLRTDRQLSTWQPLLNECIAAYRRGYFHLVVPALLCLTEGVIAAATDQLASQSSKLQKHAEAKANESDFALIWVAWQSVRGFLSRTFARAPFDAMPPTRLNRHWVLHGRHVPPASRADCLRLFQAIHTTAHLWRFAVEQADRQAESGGQ